MVFIIIIFVIIFGEILYQLLINCLKILKVNKVSTKGETNMIKRKKSIPEPMEKIKNLPALNDIISINGDIVKIEQAYVKNLSEDAITIAFSPQEMNLLCEWTYTGTGSDTYTFEDLKAFEINKKNSLSDKEREEIIEKIDIDVLAYADNKVLATFILNAVDILEEVTGLSKEEIYDETFQHGGVGEQLSNGKVYNFSDEVLNNTAYNTLVMLEESGYSKEEICDETGISDILYNRVKSE